MFRFRKKERVANGVQRIVRERLEKAIAHLASAQDGDAKGIHDARKRFKEIRAVLRLVRFELGDQFDFENRFFRDTGRALAEARDAQVLVDTFDRLQTQYPDEMERIAAGDTLRRHFEQELRRVADGTTGSMTRLPGIIESLQAADRRIDAWPLQATGFDLLKAGLARTYRQGRRAMNVAYAGGGDAQFHEWRKRIKDFWYHTKLLQPVRKDVLGVRRRRLKLLSDVVGQDHDLVVLAALLREQGSRLADEASITALSRLIVARQQELRAAARQVGALVYREKPKAYVRRMEAYWNVWRKK